MGSASVGAEAIDRAAGGNQAAHAVGRRGQEDPRPAGTPHPSAEVPPIGQRERARATRLDDRGARAGGKRVEARELERRDAVGAEREVGEHQAVAGTQAGERRTIERQMRDARYAADPLREARASDQQPLGSGGLRDQHHQSCDHDGPADALHGGLPP
jgi:hypothetical protein